MTSFADHKYPQGSTSGFNPEARDRDLQFSAKEEPATLPRVQELIIICDITPWCTVVRNERGVTLQDVCTTIWKESVPATVLSCVYADEKRYYSQIYR